MDKQHSTSENQMPHELTSPAIQRLARKGAEQELSESERIELCECVLFHINAILNRSSIPKVLGPH